MTARLAWTFLLLSGVIDVGWAIAMKKAQGFSNPTWSFVSFLLLGAFVYLLTKALAVLPLGTAYAAWTGIGALGSVIAGVLWFNEPVSLIRLASVALIVTGVAGLKVASA
ncbi:quaternary ammonium compound-resistance protein SugE [Sphingomonas sp. UYAg733]